MLRVVPPDVTSLPEPSAFCTVFAFHFLLSLSLSASASLSLSSFLPVTLFSERSPSLPALPGSLLPVRLCLSGGFGLPLEMGRASHSMWHDVGLVGRRDGGTGEQQKEGNSSGPCAEKEKGVQLRGGHGVRFIQRWLSEWLRTTFLTLNDRNKE